jgi:lysophospholipase L1-like esterase
VNSLLQRIESEEKSPVTAYNDSVVGSRMADLQTQAQTAIAQRPDVVFLLAGSNDYCAASTDAMTATVDYQQQVAQVLTSLNAALPNARIYVSSVPSPISLYNALKNNVRAQQVWAVTGSCRSLLESPQDTSPAAVARRQLVEDRANDYDSALQQACTAAARCHYDGGAITGQHINESDVSNVDFFHPSLQGQHQLADLAWAKGGLRQFLAEPTGTSSAG